MRPGPGEGEAHEEEPPTEAQLAPRVAAPARGAAAGRGPGRSTQGLPGGRPQLLLRLSRLPPVRHLHLLRRGSRRFAPLSSREAGRGATRGRQRAPGLRSPAARSLLRLRRAGLRLSRQAPSPPTFADLLRQAVTSVTVQ